MRLLYPASLLNPRKVDEHFSGEAARLGQTALYDSTENRVRGEVDTPVIYRGWILSPEDYRLMESAVESRGATMLTPTCDYIKNQHMEKWYEYFEDFTAPAWSFPTDATAEEIRKTLPENSYVLRDSSKSAKEYWLEACFVPDLESVDRVVTRFREITGDVTGLLIFREFTDLHDREVRLWWSDSECSVREWHPSVGDPTPRNDTDREIASDISSLTDKLDEFIRRVTPAVESFNTRLFTMDVTLNEGQYQIVEIGDGQVSEPHNEDTIQTVLCSLDRD